MAASHFVNVSEEEIIKMKENAIPRNTKRATKFRVKIVLNITKKPFEFLLNITSVDMHE